MNELTARLV